MSFFIKFFVGIIIIKILLLSVVAPFMMGWTLKGKCDRIDIDKTVDDAWEPAKEKVLKTLEEKDSIIMKFLVIPYIKVKFWFADIEFGIFKRVAKWSSGCE